MRLVAIAVATLGLVVTAACDPTVAPADTDETDAPEADCREVADGRDICFPFGHVCYDPHGIGDGVPIEIDCWTGGARFCHPNLNEWPECAGGWEQ